MSIPYVDAHLYKYIAHFGQAQSTSNTNGIIQMELVSTMISQVAAPKVSYSIWAGAGKDFDLIDFSNDHFGQSIAGIGWTLPALLRGERLKKKERAEPSPEVKDNPVHEPKARKLTPAMRQRMEKLLFEDALPVPAPPQPNKEELLFEDQCVIWEDSEYEPIIETDLVATEGYCAPEAYSDIATLMRRAFEMNYGSTGSILIWPIHPAAEPAKWHEGLRHDSCTWLMLAFRYYRGSERFKFVLKMDPNGNPYHVTRTVSSSDFTQDGPSFIMSPGNMQQDIGLEAPYFSRVPWQRMEDPSGGIKLLGPTAPDGALYHTVGDDFSVGMLCSPPSLWLV